MPGTITIVDEVQGAGATPRRFDFTCSKTKLSVRELLRERIFQEVARYNESTPEEFYGLVQPEGAERALNGYRMRKPKKIDADKQVQQAVKAFENNGFILLVGDRQPESLEEEIDLSGGPEVNFIRLVPLVGG